MRRVELSQAFAQHQRRTLRERRSATHLGGVDRLAGGLRARAEVVLLELRLAQLEEGSRADGSVRDLGGAGQEPLGDGEVPPFARSFRRGDQAGGRRPPQVLHGLVGRTELGPVPIRLLEVVAEDLLVFGQALAGRPLEPLREPLVEVGALLLGHRAVRGVADQEVAEAERVLAGELRSVGAD
jgi:hypothetical protein